MKKKFIKIVSGIATAVSVILAVPELSEIVKPVVAYAAETASVSSVTTSVYGSTYNIYFSGYGEKFEIYVNGDFYMTHHNSNSGWGYTDENGNYIEDEAPEMYGMNFDYGIVPGVKYEFEIVPYTKSGVKGESKKLTYTSPMPVFQNANTDCYAGIIYDDKGKTTGFRRPYANISVRLDKYWGQGVEVYKSTDKKNFKCVASQYVDTEIYYYDNEVEGGKKYYYKFRLVSDSNKVKGDFSDVYEVEVSKPSAGMELNYYDGKVHLGIYDNFCISGVDIYRSTSRTKGYKKIATTANAKYEDATVKEGKTYYYKLRPFYYDLKKEKKVYGDYSEPAGVKLLLENIVLSANQTGEDSIKLSWNKVKGVSEYEIFKKTNMAGDAYKKIATTNKTEYKLSKLNKNERCYYEVYAYKKSKGVKKYYVSSYVNVQLDSPYPSNARIVSRKLSVSGKILTVKSTIKWDKTYGAKNIKIVAYDNEKSKIITLKTIKSNNAGKYVLTNTKNLETGNVKYSDIRIIGVNGKVESDCWLSSNIAVDPAKNVKVKKKNQTSSVISWDAVKDADLYWIYRKTPFASDVCIGESSANSFIDENITPGVEYTYWVTAYNSKYQVYSSYENQYQSYSHPLSSVKITSVKNSAKKTAEIVWSKNTYASEYNVLRATSAKGKYVKIATVGKGAVSYKDTKVTKGKTYYYKVIPATTNDAGIRISGSASKAVSVKITK